LTDKQFKTCKWWLC